MLTSKAKSPTPTRATAAELRPLTPGAEVAIVAVSGPAAAGQLERAVALLESWQLTPRVYPSATVVASPGTYLAGEDHQRAADLTDAWVSPTVQGIFCLRGGYGAVRILDHLDAATFAAAAAKPLYGSSDITAVHEWLQEQLGVPSWFSPMIGTNAVLDDPVATAQLHEAVFTDPRGRVWAPTDGTVLVPGTASGRLIGGNLSLLAMTIGAHGRPPLDHRGCIALFEDVNEETYRIDGYFQALLRSGWCDGLAGIVLGSWHGCSPVPEIHQLVLELFGHQHIPIIGDMGLGHCDGADSIPLGLTVTMTTTPAPQLVLGPHSVSPSP